jgi:hypothetical protein
MHDFTLLPRNILSLSRLCTGSRSVFQNIKNNVKGTYFKITTNTVKCFLGNLKKFSHRHIL